MYKKRLSTCDILILLNVIYFLIMTLAGGTQNSEILLKFGAMFKPYVIVHGEFIRFFIAMFIHIGFLHLFMNMFVIKTVGPDFESIFGSRNFAIIYILSGLMGNMFTFAFGSVRSISAGASTSIYGIMGVVLGLLFLYKDEFHIKNFAKQYVPYIAINLLYSFSDPRVSVLGHIGGLIGGFLMTGIFDVPYHTLPKRTKLIFGATYVLLGIIFIAVGYVTAFTIGY